MSSFLIFSADQEAMTGIATIATDFGAASARDVILGRLLICIWMLSIAGLPSLAVVV